MSDLFFLAERFRHAIEIAVDNRDLKMYPFYKFPDDCCDMTSDLLAQYLKENDIETMLIIGEHAENHQWKHVWLKTIDGIIVDITCDQFNNRTNMPSNLPKVYVGKDGIIQEIFCNNLQFEHATDFINASNYDSLNGPNRREQDLLKAYKAIQKNL